MKPVLELVVNLNCAFGSFEVNLNRSICLFVVPTYVAIERLEDFVAVALKISLGCHVGHQNVCPVCGLKLKCCVCQHTVQDFTFGFQNLGHARYILALILPIYHQPLLVVFELKEPVFQ